MRGLPKSIIKKYGVTKKAWRVYRGRKGKRRKSKKTRTSNPKRKRRRTYVARRRKYRRRSRSLTIPLAPVAGLVVGIAEPIQLAMDGNIEQAAHVLVHNYTGFESDTGRFEISHLFRGLMPLVAGLLVHKFVGGAPLNFNRMLARANVPVLRI